MGRSNDEKERERLARKLDPEAWCAPLSREKDLRRLRARDQINRKNMLMPLIDIAKDARAGKTPCGECHLKRGETCDICGAVGPCTIEVECAGGVGSGGN